MDKHCSLSLHKIVVFLLIFITLLGFEGSLSLKSAQAWIGWGEEVGEFSGVKAYSNGHTHDIGYYDEDDVWHYYPTSDYGYQYQCVEYVSRFYKEIFNMNIKGGNGRDYYINASAKSLNRYANSGNTIPRIGDILCFDDSHSDNPGQKDCTWNEEIEEWECQEEAYGHVAIIRNFGSNNIEVIQQNWHNDTRDESKSISYYSTSNEVVSLGDYVVQGWLRKPGIAQLTSEFTTEGYTEGWMTFNLEDFSVNDIDPDRDGVFYIDTGVSDPYIVSPPLAVNSVEYDAVEIMMASNAPDGSGAIYFTTADSPRWSEDKKVDFSVTNDGNYHKCLVAMTNNPRWAGTITGIRIDPANHGIGDSNEDTIAFDYIRIGQAADFYLLSGTLTNSDGDPVVGWVYATETTGANLGNQVYTSNGTYEMALFPGNYNVYAYVYTHYSQGYSQIRTQTQNITIDQDSNLDIKELAYSLYHLTGKVMDTNGVGIANVAIRANHNSGDCYANITTNSDGTYDLLLIDGTYSLYFTPPADSIFLEEKIYNFQISENATHNVFLNSSEHTLSGTLIDTNQNPASGWWVYANEVNGADNKYFWYSDGTYQMSLLPSTYKVYAHAYTFYYSPNYSYTGIKTSYQTVSISGNTYCDIEVPLHDSYHLTGKVTDTSGVAQPNVEITANDSGYTYSAYTTTGSGGNYDLLLPPGTYKLTIKAPPATYPPFEIKKLTIAGDSVRNIRLSLEYTLLEEALSLLPDDLDIALDVFDIIDQADALNYDISVQGAKGLLQIILNWAGSEMKVTLYEPNGSVYGEYQSTEPPINVEIPNPTEGTWKCEVTAVDVPHDNYPFALVAGISPNESPVADANGPYSGAVDSPITFDASGSYDPDGNIVSYEWDWDGDGNFDESTDSDTITHTWIEPHSGAIVLRVKDNEGATSTDSAYVEVDAGSLLAEVDINPDVLNLTSKGNWVTSYIELPEGYAAENIDVSTVTLEGIISAESSPTQVGDHDDDGTPDLMVKFDRQTLIGYLGGAMGEVTLTLTGDVDGNSFEGSNTIIIIGQEKEQHVRPRQHRG